MSNGSKRTSDASPHGRVPADRARLRLAIAAAALVVSGCQYQQTLRSGPDLQSELRRVTAADLFELGISHARSGDFLRAEQYLSAARQRGHDEASTVYWLVRVCTMANRYQSALSHASDYLRDHPGHWPLRLVVASIYEALGLLGEAELELERVIDVNPECALPHYRLAMLYGKRPSAFERSRAHLSTYLRLNPEGRYAAQARSILAERAGLQRGPVRLESSEALTMDAGVLP